jgi:hypothetical protein
MPPPPQPTKEFFWSDDALSEAGRNLLLALIHGSDKAMHFDVL